MINAKNFFERPIVQQSLVLLGVAVLLLELSGLRTPAPVLLMTGLILSLTLFLHLSKAPFWWQVLRYSAFIGLIALLGFCHTAREIPEQRVPFALLSRNPVTPLDYKAFPDMTINALPDAQAIRTTINDRANTSPSSQPTIDSTVTLETLMTRDSVIRSALVALKEKQERDYADELARLNSQSVTDTGMLRNALSPATIDELYREHAISGARYRTYRETWKLLDKDVAAFREKQADERFRVLLGLLENDQINESDKVSFITYMARTYSNDVRLVHPLINLYARLDTDYPRQKRRHSEFLNLYIAKREAILAALQRSGPAARQPLLDHRRKTIAQMTYSQARLDKFLRETYGDNEAMVQPLYSIAKPSVIPAFLNRSKYPPLGRLQGPDYEQEYLRLNSLRLAKANAAPAVGTPLMGLSDTRYQQMQDTINSGYSSEIDRWVIDPDDAVRVNVAWLLAQRKDPLLLPITLDLLKDPNPEVRRLAAICSGTFTLVDAQGANDPKFIALITTLQNYRSNTDTYARAWAVLGLASTGDRTKALFTIDLILNDGVDSHSLLGEAAPTWRSEEEQAAVAGLIKTLNRTPESMYVKTQALNALIAIDSPEAMGVLLHYLRRTYDHYHMEPTLWRTIVPHLSLPQEAENIEDVLRYIAARHGAGDRDYQQRNLEALELHLQSAYQDKHSGQYFQLLDFLRDFDEVTYTEYVASHLEHIRYMRALEYLRCTYKPWLYFWAVSLIAVIALLRLRSPGSVAGRASPDNVARRANPAATTPMQQRPPAAALLPIRVNKRA